tara:strand:- start:73 stop:606 length:534 start_codon:yes stop_codon:yes gene_type:complete
MRNIEQKSLSLLKEYNLDILPVDIKKVINKLKLKLACYDLGKGVSGVLVVNKGDVKIGYSLFESEERQRFTMAHELGHYILHCNDSENKLFVDDIKVKFRRDQSTKQEQKEEKEANIFAASLLMPKELINTEFNKLMKDKLILSDEEIVEKLADNFKVSSIAMTYRLINLGYMHSKF